MMEQDNHPDILELVAWARGAIPKRRLGEIRAHCRTCPDCDAKLARILLLRSKHRREMRRRARRRRQLQMAAAVLLVVGAGAVFLSGYFSDPASELAALATTETIPESHVGLRFRVAVPASPGGYDSEFKAGMEALVRGDYPAAVEMLESLHAAHERDTEVSTYLCLETIRIARKLSWPRVRRTCREESAEPPPGSWRTHA